MPRTWAFTERRKKLRLQAVSRQRWLIAFFVGMILLLALIVWLRLSATRPQLLPEVLVVAGVLVVLALWLLPKWQVARSQGLTTGNRFDRENEARKTLAQIIGGVFVLAGLYSSLQTFNLQQHTFDLQREGQITDRFTKAIDQLGAVETGADGKPQINLEVRLGAIYALERVARDSRTDHWTIIEVLSTYVQENSPATNPAEAGEQHLRADIQAILSVIGRRDRSYDEQQVNLSHADLGGAYLDEAHLVEAHLSGAHLDGAHLSGADLDRSDLSGVDLHGADLSKADLRGVDLHGADLSKADLRGVDLDGANLNEAYLKGARLDGARLDGAHLDGRSNGRISSGRTSQGQNSPRRTSMGRASKRQT
jgi:uncharacterized protein YjbI with pentapeptide repeats